MSLITKDSFIHSRLQNFVAGMLFPAGKGDWYKNKKYGNNEGLSPAKNFCQQQKRDETAYYYDSFKGLSIDTNSVRSQLANGEQCSLETFICSPETPDKTLPGNGKHIIYFPGADTYYQACFRDISTAARETGATIHAFNFPGTGLSTGRVKEANDLTNAGIAMVRSLLSKGVHPDNIVLQGDCFGAAIAMEVKEQIAIQAGVQVRLIMNNAFESFKAAVYDLITSSSWLPAILKSIIEPLLTFTGWHLCPGEKFIHSDPYQCHIKHDGDLVLPSGTLSDKVQRMRTSKDFKDTCPEEYKPERDKLDRMHILKVREDAKDRLGKKFGLDKYGRINAHFADLCEMESGDGTPAYEGFVNQFLSSTNAYIEAHQQDCDPSALAEQLQYIKNAEAHSITRTDAEIMQEFCALVEEELSNRVIIEEDESEGLSTSSPDSDASTTYQP